MKAQLILKTTLEKFNRNKKNNMLKVQLDNYDSRIDVTDFSEMIRENQFEMEVSECGQGMKIRDGR